MGVEARPGESMKATVGGATAAGATLEDIQSAVKTDETRETPWDANKADNNNQLVDPNTWTASRRRHDHDRRPEDGPRQEPSPNAADNPSRTWRSR